MWSWAVHNVNRDFREREKLLFSFMESLTWWLQPELKGKIDRDKKNRWPDADMKTFADGLREGGADEAYIKSEIDKITEERRKQREAEELLEDGDDIQILRGPNK